MQNINPTDLHKKFAEGEALHIIDVRSPVEYALGHIPGAQNYPVDRIDRQIEEFDPAAELFVVCQSGVRSVTACNKLEGVHTNLVNVLGGTSAWSGEGFEIRRGLKP